MRPGPATPTRTTTIDTADGALYAEVFLPSPDAKTEPKGVVVVSHGYAEHCGRYREVAHVITNAGWTALTYDVRGHGHSPGPRGYIDRFSIYLDDLAKVHAAGRALVPAATPTVLLGHSHGGLITLRALCGDHPPAAVHAVLSSPFLALKLAVPAHKRLLAKVGSFLAPKLAQANTLVVEDLTRDKDKQAERTADKLCFDVATARWFTEAMAAQDYCTANAKRTKVPTTWLVGGADPIADPAHSKRVASTMTGAQFHDLADDKHEVFNEIDREKPFAELTQVLATCAAK